MPVLGAGPAATDKRTHPDDVKHALEAAFAAGADGVVLSREYVEMWTANLTSAGDTLREIFAQQAAKGVGRVFRRFERVFKGLQPKLFLVEHFGLESLNACV